MKDIFIGRQPILDIHGKLYGYELLCRDRKGRVAVSGNGDRDSIRMLLDAIFDVGIERLTHSQPAFINATRTLLLSDLVDSLPSDNIVLEVLETVEVDAELLERLRQLRKRGFTIALDDYVLTDARKSLLEHADIVKLDVRALDHHSLREHLARCRNGRMLMLAEKVETKEEYEQLRTLGFDLFQGYHFARPEVYTARLLRPNRLAVLELMAKISEPDVSVNQLAQLIRNDVAMSVAILRFANAAAVGLKSRVESVDRAVVTLGLRTIQNWAGLIALSRLKSTPGQLLTISLVRARSCELLASAAGRDNPAAYFTVGLFSLLDVMMESPMDALLEKLPLPDEMKAALSTQSGDLGAALRCVVAMELGDLDGITFGSLELRHTGACYQQAIEWTDALPIQPE